MKLKRPDLMKQLKKPYIFGAVATKLFFFALCASFLPLQAQETVVIKGSDTLGAKLVPQLAEAYKNAGHNVNFEIAAEGSSTAFSNLIAGTTDIGMSSRQVEDKEKADATSKGIELVEKIAAYDMIAIIVNQNNPVQELTLQQVEEIFTGEVMDWSEIGGSAGEISVYTRNTASGTYKDFQKLAMNKRDYGANAQKMAGNEQIATEVGKNPNGIGYVGLAYSSAEGIVQVAVNGLLPEAKNATTYVLSRATYYYTNGEAAGEVKTFLDFCLGKEGDEMVEQVGFIPVSKSAAQATND